VYAFHKFGEAVGFGGEDCNSSETGANPPRIDLLNVIFLKVGDALASITISADYSLPERQIE
jgi:hypothetical protein